VTNLGFAIVDKDEQRQRAARAESFLVVPLIVAFMKSFAASNYHRVRMA